MKSAEQKPNTGNVVLALEGVSKSFGSSEVLSQVDLSVRSGTATALIGTSGSGKSTILRLILGMYTPSQGKLYWWGQDLAKLDPKQLRLKTGYVLQDGGLFPHLDIFENIAIVSRYLGWTQQKIVARIQEMLDLVQLESSLLKRRPRELSGGQRQRVGIARALMLDPEILLLDEPFGALDPVTRYDLQTQTKELIYGLKKSAIIVTHDIHEARYFSQDLYLLHQGKIAQYGSFESMSANPANEFVRRFISAQSPRDFDEGRTNG